MTKQAVRDPIDTALAPFDASPVGFTEAAVGDALRNIRDSVPESQRRRWWAESAAARFREVKEGDSVWGTAFGPMAVLKNEAGEEVYSPDVKDADITTLDYWTKRSKEAKHPILRARYADLAWDFAPVVAKRRANVDDARLAIDAYIAASKLDYRSAIRPIGYLQRGLHLALSIRSYLINGEAG